MIRWIIYPKGVNGPWYQPISFGEGYDSYSINMNMALKQASITMRAGIAWVYVINQTTGGGIQFLENGKVHTTLSGLTNSMTDRYFVFDMPSVPGSKQFADSLLITKGFWKFGPLGNEVDLRQAENDSTQKKPLIWKTARCIVK